MPRAGLTLRKRKIAPEILRAVKWMAEAPGAGVS
jgi:hypothetical protein